MKVFKIVLSAKKYFLESYSCYLNSRARRTLQKNYSLWRMLDDYLTRSTSSGCAYSDYLVLYNHIRRTKPLEVLECGTGVSTIIMAYALMENEREGNPRGRIISMEESEKWHRLARELLPEELKPYVEIILSPPEEDYYAFFRGVRYARIPDRQYEFVFVDGPYSRSPKDGAPIFDFDFIRVVERSKGSVCGIVDMRHSTCYVLQEVFGPQKFKYDYARNLGFIGPVRKEDMRDTGAIASSFVARPFRTYRFLKQELKNFLGS
ncbi:MAG: class I SAM-dependent methyltransferase [Candidatus Niyogibacteria bacterium]|nr:class I SAM-dependent methyltransferase [Candidatus Niyogibacteria bacterium]